MTKIIELAVTGDFSTFIKAFFLILAITVPLSMARFVNVEIHTDSDNRITDSGTFKNGGDNIEEM